MPSSTYKTLFKKQNNRHPKFNVQCPLSQIGDSFKLKTKSWHLWNLNEKNLKKMKRRVNSTLIFEPKFTFI